MPSSLELAKPKIEHALASPGPRVVDTEELYDIWRTARRRWGVAKTTAFARFLEFAVKACGLREAKLSSDQYSPKIRYIWGEPSAYRVALSLNERAYLSHGSAVFLHGLTDQIPKTIYVNIEQSPKPRPTVAPTQEAIDRAFSNRQRLSKLQYRYQHYTITVIAGKWTDALGVITTKVDSRPVRVTNLERTLVDIAVRPGYAGGLVQVMEAYRRARDRTSGKRLATTLRKLDYVYPYHQALGFIMQRAGYPREELDILASLGTKYDFYLGYALRETEFDSFWRIHYPKGF